MVGLGEGGAGFCFSLRSRCLAEPRDETPGLVVVVLTESATIGRSTRSSLCESESAAPRGATRTPTRHTDTFEAIERDYAALNGHPIGLTPAVSRHLSARSGSLPRRI